MYRCLAREVSSREKGFFGGYCFRKWGLEYFGVRFLKQMRNSKVFKFVDIKQEYIYSVDYGSIVNFNDFP